MRTRLMSIALICLTALTVLLSACAPAIPHATAGRSECIACHGKNAANAYPNWHAKRNFGNDICTKCHAVKP
jgi:hypothetical protein